MPACRRAIRTVFSSAACPTKTGSCIYPSSAVQGARWVDVLILPADPGIGWLPFFAAGLWLSNAARDTNTHPLRRHP